MCVKIAKTFIHKKDYHKIDGILDKSRLFFLRYTGLHGGHRLHIDNPKKRNGPVFLINLGYSTIDYIPFVEIPNKIYKAYRFNIKPGEVFIMDGDSRFSYSHGVPPNINIKNYLRYVMIIRFPSVYKKTKLCKLTNKYIKHNWECYSSTEDIYV